MKAILLVFLYISSIFSQEEDKVENLLELPAPNGETHDLLKKGLLVGQTLGRNIYFIFMIQHGEKVKR
jgi:hypothetical protein